MQTFYTAPDLVGVENNSVIGAENLTMDDSEIVFAGVNNILLIEDKAVLRHSRICFKGNNSIVYLSSSGRRYYHIDVELHQSCAFFCGKNNFFNGALKVRLSEHKHMLIGSGCLFSMGIWVRTADPHLVYSAASRQRVNPSKSVYIGDHVWIGQEVMLLKGSQIFSGSIIGARAVVAGKRIPSNTSFAGNPAKKIGDGVFWDEPCVHNWSEKQTAASQHYTGKESFVYQYTEGESIPFDSLEQRLCDAVTAEDKRDILQAVAQNSNKNRFASCPPKPAMPAKKSLRQRLRLRLKAILLRIMK